MTVTINDWIFALRSREFGQGQGYLYRPATNEYCCLGVLCKIGGADFSDIDNEHWVSEFVYVDDNSFQNDQVREEILSLLDRDYGLSADSLASANDNGASFEKIARYLEYVRDYIPDDKYALPSDYHEWSEYID